MERATSFADGLHPTRLHNVLYAISQGPILPSDDDTHHVVFSNHAQGTLGDLNISRHNGFLSHDDRGVTLSDLGADVLAYLNQTCGSSAWEKSKSQAPAPVAAQA